MKLLSTCCGKPAVAGQVEKLHMKSGQTLDVGICSECQLQKVFTESKYWKKRKRK